MGHPSIVLRCRLEGHGRALPGGQPGAAVFTYIKAFLLRLRLLG